MLADMEKLVGMTNSVEALDVFYVRLDCELDLVGKGTSTSSTGP
jgi:hypothetical protein